MRKVTTKKIFSVLLTVVMVMSMLPLSAFAATDGTESTTPDSKWTDAGNYNTYWYVGTTTYNIDNENQLAGLAYLVNTRRMSFSGKNIKINKDLDLSAHCWVPIGTADSPFCGNFLGQGHTISGVIVNSDKDYAGLFGKVGNSSGSSLNSAGVKDIHLKNASITGKNYVGGIAGALDDAVASNCSVDGSINGVCYVGGVFGGLSMGVDVMSCTASGDVTGTISVGGVVGENKSSTVLKCTNRATVNAITASNQTRSMTGGIVGYSNGVIRYCGNYGQINGFDNIGGIVGKQEISMLDSCFNTAPVTGSTFSKIGSIGVCESSATVRNCYYVYGTAKPGVYVDSSDAEEIKNGVAFKTLAQFKSGEVTYLLNQGETTDQPFFQNIDNGSAKDDYPVFSGETVYKINKYLTCDKRDTPSNLYSNTNADVFPEHSLKYETDETGTYILELCKNCSSYLEKAWLGRWFDSSYSPTDPPVGAYLETTSGWKGGRLEVHSLNNEKVGTATAYIEKDGARVEINYQVTQRVISRPKKDTTNFVYNGSEQIYNIPEDTVYTITGNKQTNAGDYTVTVTLKDTENYKWYMGGLNEFSITYDFKIEKKQIGIEWGDTEFNYDGSAHVPQAVPNEEDLIPGDNIEFIVEGAATDANADGESYTATVVGITGPDAENYALPEDCTKEFRILKTTNPAPEVFGVNETVRNKNDGKITGTSDMMEYRSENSNDYTKVTGTEITDLAPGTYYVRYAASKNYNVSPESKVVIAEGKSVYINSVDTPAYKLIPDKSSYLYNETATLHFELKPGYSKTVEFKITVGVKTAVLDENGDLTFTVNDGFAFTEQDDLLLCKVEVFGVADITKPEVEINIKNNKFKEFLNSVTFGLFFKETQTVTVTASDAGSGIKTVEYLLSETAFTDKDAITGDWTELAFEDGKASFDIKPNKKAYVYVRVTDESGNVQVINSEGVVVYTDSEAVTEDVNFTMLDKADVTFDVKLNGNTVKALYNGDELIDSANYTVSADGTVTLKNSYLSTLAAGEYTISVKYNPMGEEYKTGDEPVMTLVKLTVEKKTPIHDHMSSDGKIYDGKSIGMPTFNTDSDGALTFEYKLADADDTAYTTTAPKNVGIYTIRITTAETDTFKAASSTMEFEIQPKEVTISGVTVEASKIYDGTTAAKITNAGTLSVNYDGDNLTIVSGKAAYDDKNVGTGKTVTFTDFALAGDAAGNYVLVSQPSSVKADITAKELTVDNLKIKDKQYDGTNTAEFDGTPTLVGVVDGDDLKLINGTPTFDSITIGKDIPVSFTEFTLSGDDVTVGNYKLIQPDSTTANIVEYISDGSEYSVNSNDWINTDFVITAKDGYKLSLTDTADGEWANELTASEETDNGSLTFYVKNTATGAISTVVTENYKIDKTVPTGEIKLNEHTSSWNDFDEISFSLFFNDNVNFKLTADDNASGIKSVMYYKADELLTDSEVKAITDWTDNSDFDIEAKDMDQFIIYVRIEDNAGNVSFIGSDGAIFDTTAPEVIGVENDKTYYVTKRVAIDDENLELLTVNDEAVDGVFTLEGDTDATYVIKATDKAGNVTEYTVTMKPISTITDAISNITVDNVKSSDSDTVSDVERQILDIAEMFDEDESTEEEWNKLIEASAKCKELEKRIEEIAAEITRLTDAVKDFAPETVKNGDKADIEKLIADIDTLLGGENLTDFERSSLEALKATAQALLDRISLAKNASESDEIKTVENITKDNVKSEDKDNLEKAEKELEKALEDFGGNYTEEERKDLEEKLETVKDALEAIDNAEKAADEIGKLPSPDEVKLKDKDELNRVKEIIDKLTENEKSMLGDKAIGKVNALLEKITALEKISFAPSIIEGAGQKWNAGSGKNARFCSNAEFDEFVKVLVDGKELDKSNYTVSEGSTVVELKAAYLETLSAGEHTLSIVSKNGTAVTTFTVVETQDKNSPQTGDDSGNIALWLALAFIGGSAVIGKTVCGRRKKYLAK